MAGKVFDKVKNFIGLEEFDDEILEEQIVEEGHMPKEAPSYTNANLQKSSNKVVNIHTANQMKVVIFEPVEFEQSSEIVDSLKLRKPVIINLEKLDNDLARKIFDFLNGAVYALDGKIQKVSAGIFILAPSNIDIHGNIKDELKSKGIMNWYK